MDLTELKFGIKVNFFMKRDLQYISDKNSHNV